MHRPHSSSSSPVGAPGGGQALPVIDPEMLDPTAPVELDARAEVEHLAPRASAHRHHEVVIKSGRLAGLTMKAAIIALAWPVLCESVLNSLVGLVDTWVSAQISQSATDAVGGAAYLLWFMGLITMAIGVGATALISRSIGAGKTAIARAALGQAMTLAAIGGLGLAVVMYFVAPAMASVMSMQGEAAADFVIYLRALCWGMPGATIMFAGTACARGAGDTLRPLLVMSVVNVVNLAVCYSLAVWLKMDVLGIGLGTSIAQSIGAALIVYFHVRGSSGIVLKRRWLSLHRVTAYRMIRLGLPNFFETFGMWVVNFTTVLMVGWMGAAELAKKSATAVGDSGGYLGAHLLAIRLEAFSFLPGFSMGIAAGALVGQYLGAGSPESARKAAWACARIAALIMGIGGVVLIFFGHFVVSLISHQPAHLQITPTLLMITGFTQIPFALAIVLRSAMQGAGDVKAVMILTWISQWGMRLPLAYAISGVNIPIPEMFGGGVFVNPFPFQLGLPGLWIGLCAEIVIRCCLYGARFLNGGWLKARV